jgi:ABC-type lipoprotein release transport system permease subunit
MIREESPVQEVPLEEKNHKKRVAVMAAKEHGAQLFKEGQYQQALAVYERVRCMQHGLLAFIYLLIMIIVCFQMFRLFS